MIYRFNVIAIKISSFLEEIDKMIIKFKRKCKSSRIDQIIFSCKRRTKLKALPHLRNYYKAVVIKTFFIGIRIDI